MPVPLIAAAATAGKVAGIFGIDLSGGSPRYAGGPLISTVRADVAAIAGGDLATIRKWDTARKTAKDAAAWQQVWQNELPAIALNTAQSNLVRSLDPTLGVTGAGGSSSLPQAPSTPSSAPQGGPSLLGGDLGTLVLVGLVLFAVVYFFKNR